MIEQFINFILYYHYAHFNHFMFSINYESKFAKFQILFFLYMLLNYRILQDSNLINHEFIKSSSEIKTFVTHQIKLSDT